MTSQRISDYIQSLRRSDLFGHRVAVYQMISGCDGRMRSVPDFLSNTVVRLLSFSDIPKLHSHQIEALESIRSGRPTVVATPRSWKASAKFSTPILSFTNGFCKILPATWCALIPGRKGWVQSKSSGLQLSNRLKATVMRRRLSIFSTWPVIVGSVVSAFLIKDSIVLPCPTITIQHLKKENVNRHWNIGSEGRRNAVSFWL